MKVYLVQHAEATSKETDPERPLTARGRQAMVLMAALGARMDLKVQQIRHSGKRRAQETASILGEALSPPGGVVESEGLGPLDDVEPVATALTQATEPIMLVGHLPFLERLVGMMVVDDPDHTVVRFHNAGIVCLDRDEGQWQVVWSITPEIMRT